MQETDDNTKPEAAQDPSRPASSVGLRAKQLKLWNPISSFLDKDPMTLAASIAFYSALSFAPILVLGMILASQMSPRLARVLVNFSIRETMAH